MEMIKNAGQVALEMGNSPAMVKKHYYEIVDSAAAARQYWSIAPIARSGKVVQMA